MAVHEGLEKWCRLTNTSHTEIVPHLPLPSLPLCCGDSDQTLSRSSDFTRVVNREDNLVHAAVLADLLRDCDVAYLNLKQEYIAAPEGSGECSRLYSEVLKYNDKAFKCSSSGALQMQNSSYFVAENIPTEHNLSTFAQGQRDGEVMLKAHLDDSAMRGAPGSGELKKPTFKKREIDSLSIKTDVPDHQDVIGNFCEILDEFCEKTEDLNAGEGPSIPLSDVKMLINEIMSIRTKKSLQLVPIDALVRLLNALDRLVQAGQGLSIDANEDPDSDSAASVVCALESTHAALAIMAHEDMPKQVYKEEIIERIVDFSRQQIVVCLAVFNPSYRAPYNSSENAKLNGDEDDNEDIEDTSASKRGRNVRNTSMKKPPGIRISGAISSIIQKLSSVLVFLKVLLSVVRLSDSCILQLLKTSFETFLADSMNLLQLKSIDLISEVFAIYVQHRNFMIEELVHLLSKLQISKRTLRAYHLQDDESKQIQMITALLIHLVQSSTNPSDFVRPTSNWASVVDASVDANYPLKCLGYATEVCCPFWTSVLQRVTTPKGQDISDFKVIMENLVIDLLTTLNLPEYPASATILEVLCVLLLQNAGLKSKDIVARGIAIDLLGVIATRLKRDALLCSRDRLWILQALAVEEDNNDPADRTDECSVCGKARGASIVCRMCRRCFHADCLRVADQEMLLRDWSCHICFCQKQLTILKSYCKKQSNEEGEKKKRSSGKTSETFKPSAKMEILQHMLLTYLQETGSKDDEKFSTRWFYLCTWYKDEPQSQERVIYYLARLLAKNILRGDGSNMVVPSDWAKRICLALGQKNSFCRGFDKILSLLLTTLRENSSNLRAKAIRAVSGIVEADPEVLCDKRVQSAVEGRFCDSAISVREAALELVGRHIASHPDVGVKYFEKVAERIKDTGVSVRKRAIKIIRDLCTSKSNFPEASRAFVEIISRVTDEESSVQDLVCKTFYELWFETPPGSQTQFVGDGSSVPIEVANKTEQIVDILRKLPSHHLLVTVIKRNLALDFLPQSAKASGISAVSLASVRKRCEVVCKRLLERILQVEEGVNEDEEVQALPYVMALHAFCIVDPKLCIPATDPSHFVVTLQPYLKNQVDNKAIAKLLESIVFVIDAVLPLLRKPPHSVIQELEQDLKHMIVRHSYMTVVHSCIRCLCSLSKVAGRGTSVVEYLIQLFFKHLHSPNDNKQLLGRSLFCFGLLIRYGNDLMVSSTNQPIRIARSLSLLKKYMLAEDFNLKIRALQALGHVLVARPESMLEKDIREIIEDTLSSDSDSRLKLQSLQNVYEYLLVAESQLAGDGASKTEIQYSENVRNGLPVAAGAGDTNICGGIVQLYWNNILERGLDANDQVRLTTLKIVEIVLRQGLVHPITCVPCLIALETDPLEANAKLAHHLLMNMNEKYPAFFESRLGDGLQLSYKFVQSISGFGVMVQENMKRKTNISNMACVRSGVSRIYRLIRGNRASRHKFMHSIVRKFETGWNYVSIPFLLYCTEILSSLPFTNPDEPLYLIYDINRVIQVRAGTLEANLKMWSSLSQQQDLVKPLYATHNGLVNMGYHVSENAMLAPAEASLDNSSGIVNDNLQKIQADCHDAIALQLLLKLKRHLKLVYGLSDTRCQAFSVKELPKPGESLSRQNIPFDISDVVIHLPNSLQDMIVIYQGFKQALKEDTMDYASYSADIKRKRPTPRSAKGGRSAQRRTANVGYDDDDDVDDANDEDWTGGPRRLNFSGVNVNSSGGRVTRQRMQA